MTLLLGASRVGAEPPPLAALAPAPCERIGYRNPSASTRVADLAPYCVQGGAEVPLDGEALYRALGRADLEKRYEKRRAARVSFLVAGGILGAGAIGSLSLSALLPHAGPCLSLASDGTCRRYEDSFSERLLLGVGTALVIATAGLVAEGLLMDPHPVSAPELRGVIDQRNQAVERPRPASSPAPPPVALLLAPMVGPTGGGLSLTGRF